MIVLSFVSFAPQASAACIHRDGHTGQITVNPSECTSPPNVDPDEWIDFVQNTVFWAADIVVCTIEMVQGNDC